MAVGAQSHRERTGTVPLLRKMAPIGLLRLNVRRLKGGQKEDGMGEESLEGCEDFRNWVYI